jgi:hypothetical protein
MSMHLVGPYMTTTKYNRKHKPSKSKRLAAKQAEHEQWLAKMGYKGTGTDYRAPMPDYSSKTGNNIPTSDRIDGHAPQKERNVYSGERTLLGVATMHKSNMVPVFADKKEDAKDIAAMRRN